MKTLTTNDDVYSLLHASAGSAALGAAITTGLLWMLAEKPMKGEEVVQVLRIPGRRGHYWLQYLQSFGILETVPQGYIPSSVVRSAILDSKSRESWQHLVIDEQEKDACVHGLPQLLSQPGSLWTIQGLEEPKNYVDRMRASPERAREFTRMLFEVHQNLANQLVELLDLTGVEHLMDLGGNSGVISMALLRKYPSLTSTVVDIENVCVAGREIAEEEGFSDRITYHAAEFADDEFPSGFDLVLQCDVAVYGIDLLKKMFQSLKPSGRLIFVDHFSPAENLAPTTRLEWTFLDSLHDPNFSFPTLDEFESQLAQTGFSVSDERQTLGNGLIVLQAWKRDGKVFDEMDNNTVYEWILHSTFTVSAREESLQSAKPQLSTLIHPGDEILDLCCGSGFVSFWLEELGAKVTGIDFAPYMIALAMEEASRRSSKVRFIEADIFAQDFGQDRFDLISCFDSISDFPVLDFAKLGKKIASALKPGGRFVVKYMDDSYKFIQGIHPRAGVFQEVPERITYRFKEYLPEIGAKVNIIRNETRGEEYERKAYIYTVPAVRLAMGTALKLEQHIVLGEDQFMDIYIKQKGQVEI